VMIKALQIASARRAHRALSLPPPPSVAAFASVSNVGINLTIPKLIYLGLNGIGCAFLLYKVRSMGLLPITSSDWISLLPARQAAEHSSVGIGL
jgi:hypothetical protein